MSLYSTLSVVLLIPALCAAGLAAWRLRGHARRAWAWGTAGAVTGLVVLTAIFDNIMIGVGLVAYDDDVTSGIRLGLAPVEDFSYALAAGLLLPAAWAWLTRDDAAESARAGGAALDDTATETPAPAPAARRRRILADLFWTSRPVSWINTAAPFVLAYLLATRELDAVAVVGTLFFLVPYNLAMYGINDVFDYESDLDNPRKGGVEGAVLDRSRHRSVLVAAAVSCLPPALYLFAVGTVESGVLLAVTLAAVVAYSLKYLRFKEIPFLDSLTSAVHFAGPAAFGWSIGGGSWTSAAVVCVAAFLLWGAGSHSFGAVQDIQYDRAATIASIGTVLGARATVWFSFGSYVAAAILLLVAAPWPASGAAFAVLPYLAMVGVHLTVTDDRADETRRGWGRFLVLNVLAGFLVSQLILWEIVVWGPGVVTGIS